MIKIDGLTTENVNEATKHIDQMDSLGKIGRASCRERV